MVLNLAPIGVSLSLVIAAAALAPIHGGFQDPPGDPGHIVLVIEGSVLRLQVTHAVAKPDAWAGTPKGLHSEFQFVAVDAAGKELVRVPIDLSKFETDPAKVGTPDVVTGCEVRSARIGVLLSVPRLADAARFSIVRGRSQLASLTALEMQTLLRGER